MKLFVFYKTTLFLFGTMTLTCMTPPLKAMNELENEKSSYRVKFAVIGDYGTGSEGAHKVSALVKSWEPDFILTTGDNNYPKGEAETIDKNIGAFYSPYVYSYTGKYEQPSVTHNGTVANDEVCGF